MKKAKLVVMIEEFPFLSGVIKECAWDAEAGNIKVARMDTAFLSVVPTEESYVSSAGRSSRRSRLFAVRGGKVSEVKLTPALDHSTGYAYDRPIREEGQTFLSSLVEEESFDFLVRHEYAYCSWQDGGDEDVLTILKPSKHSSIVEEWEKALASARHELFKEADV